jgi:hypothetical protein
VAEVKRSTTLVSLLEGVEHVEGFGEYREFMN